MIFGVVVFLVVCAIAEPLAIAFAWFHFTFYGWLADVDPFRLGIDTRAKARVFYRWGIRAVGLLWLVMITITACSEG